LAQKTDDLRVRRTRKLLQQALLQVTIEKGFANVTVQDIAERAMVNRSTFYRHYLDKYDLLKEYMEQLYALTPSQDKLVSADEPDQPPAWLVGILTHVQLNADFYRVMLGAKGDPAFCAQSFRQFIEKQLREIVPSESVQTDPRTPPVQLRVSYLAHAGIGAIVWWLENDQPCTPEQLAVWLDQLTSATLGLFATKGIPTK
jgi:AcrR family transcriptional regulator